MSLEPSRRAEVIIALSLATDLAIGQPIDFALKSCVLSLRIGAALERPREELSEIYYQSLLRYVGCNADTYVLSTLFGDEIALRRDLAPADLGNDLQVLQIILRAVRRANAGGALASVAAAVFRAAALGKRTSMSVLSGHCEVAGRLAERLALGPGIARNLNQLYERWDGKGLPAGLKGEAISPAVRVVTLAQDVLVLLEATSKSDMLLSIRERKAKIYDPAVADVFLKGADAMLRDLDHAATIDTVLSLEPQPWVWLSEEEKDEACLVMADFVDMRTPFTLGHSRAVAGLAEAAARAAGLAEQQAILLRRAGLVHDIGELATPTAVWIRAEPLGYRDRESIRLHPYYAERVLARPAFLAEAATLAGQHHERLDGSGYHRGSRSAAAAFPSKILAAAEFFQTRVEPRPHRPGLTVDAAASALENEVREGRLDGDAAAAVLKAAGRRSHVRGRSVNELTRREVEVLQELARGRTTKQLAATLGIAPKTADNHVQNLYSKIGVSTRAGAILFAVENGLIATV